MKNQKLTLRVIIYTYIIISVQGCSSYLHQPMLGGSSRARLGPETPVYHELKEMPIPENPVVVAVYKFRDQTGQYKPADMGQSWSTAITQGATTILIRALEESGWFIPIERENIGNLLNERKIIRSSRMQYSNNKDSKLLPPLLFAGVILEGGIISYESNIRTGGMGLRYFGTGGSTQYREDRVSIYLRAVSTNNGKILKTVYTTKSILSQKVDVGVFKYVDVDRILEAETGYTKNEPSEMAVTEAIQMAVESIIFEGIEDKLWNTKDGENIKENTVYINYIEKKNRNLATNQYGVVQNYNQRGKMSVGIYGGTQMYEGDFNNNTYSPLAGVDFNLKLTNNSFLSTNIELGKLSATNNFVSNLLNINAKYRYIFLPLERFTPTFNIGTGVAFGNSKSSGLAKKELIAPNICSGLGVEYMFSNKISVSLVGNYIYYLSDAVDGKNVGKFNDSAINFNLGLRYYIN